MDLSKKLSELGITGAELSHELRGFYSTAFFHIYTQGDFKMDLGQISQKDRGTFIHEYVHYWQNIGTLYGLADSILRYDELMYFKSKLFLVSGYRLAIPA